VVLKLKADVPGEGEGEGEAEIIYTPRDSARTPTYPDARTRQMFTDTPWDLGRETDGERDDATHTLGTHVETDIDRVFEYDSLLDAGEGFETHPDSHMHAPLETYMDTPADSYTGSNSQNLSHYDITYRH